MTVRVGHLAALSSRILLSLFILLVLRLDRYATVVASQLNGINFHSDRLFFQIN